LIIHSADYARGLFDDKEHLFRSVFEYYDLPFDPAAAEKIVDLLGEKSEERPIELLDTMNIQLLKNN